MDSEIKPLKMPYFNNRRKKNIFKLIIPFIFIIINSILFYEIKKILKNLEFNLANQNKILKTEEKVNIGLLNNNLENDISEKLKFLKIITNNNHLIYNGVQNCLLNNGDNQYCIYHLISPKKVIGKKRIIIGDKRDGCYILLNDFKYINIAYSFGISNKIQFDKELADRGIDVYMYDHTINYLPYNHPKFHWRKIGICGKKEKDSQLKSLDVLLKENGHSSEKNMILKMDVEYNEWNSLKDLSDNLLKQFKYIIIEFHFWKPRKESKIYYEVLQKLEKNHQVFYFRCHKRTKISSFGNNRICRNLEVSYVIKEGNQFTSDDSIYPLFEFDFEGPRSTKNLEYNLNIIKLFDF